MDLSISETATGLVGHLILAKKFPFFGHFYSHVSIHTNGYISLGDDDDDVLPQIQEFQTAGSLKAGGEVFYREVLNETKVFEKIQKDLRDSSTDSLFEAKWALIVT